MRAAYPDAPDEADTEIREDGIACHWLAAEIFNGRFPALNSFAPNNRALTEEMFYAVDMYLDVLRGWQGAVKVEQQLDCSAIYPGMKGTPDAWCYTPTVIDVVDLKFGFRFVEVWENLQLVCYAAAILELMGVDGAQDQQLQFRFTIVQPRSYHHEGPIRTWTIGASELRGHINWLRAAAINAMKPNALCVANPGCTNCPARHACSALQNSALTALEQSYAGIPLELSPTGVGDELRRLKEAAKHLDARITGLEGQAESLLRTGNVVPGWSLEPSFARERWRDGTESQVMTLGRYYNVDTAKPAQAVSPAQARKLLPPEIVAAYAFRPSTGVRLTKQDKFQARKKFQPLSE